MDTAMDTAMEQVSSLVEEESDSCERRASAEAPHARRQVALRCAGSAAVAGLLLLTACWLGGGRSGSGADYRTSALRGAVELEADNSSHGERRGCNGSDTGCRRGEVSLYCFSQMVAHGAEEDLVRKQFHHRISIFACNDYDVTCAQRRLLGTDEDGNDHHTLLNPETGKAQLGDVNSGAATASFLNVLIFIKAWDILLKRGKIWKHDWTVKVDPDCVFFPQRLRSQLKDHTGSDESATYLLNCREQQPYQGNVFLPKLYGAMEVYNTKAMRAYEEHAQQKCIDGQPWQKWGEDLYMRVCMDTLGAAQFVDYELVGDKRCFGNPPSSCGDANRPGYHPYKETSAWFACWNQSMGVAVTDAGVEPWGICGGGGKPQLQCPEGWHCHYDNWWYAQCRPTF